MLPFDDDDESVMRDKIIIGEFEDPTWLSIGMQFLTSSEQSHSLQRPVILSKASSRRIP